MDRPLEICILLVHTYMNSKNHPHQENYIQVNIIVGRSNR